MFSSPALCRFRNTRTQCLLEKNENHGTLVGIVGFRAGMKHKTFTIYCTQQHRMATCQPHNHLCNRILCDTSLAVLFAYYAFTPLPRLIPNVRFFLQYLTLLLQRQSAMSPPGQPEHYITWGLTKVLLKE
jgi:hypothetical protein